MELLTDKLQAFPPQNMDNKRGAVVSITSVSPCGETGMELDDVRFEDAERVSVRFARLGHGSQSTGAQVYLAHEFPDFQAAYNADTPEQLVGRLAIALHTNDEYAKATDDRRHTGLVPLNPY